MLPNEDIVEVGQEIQLRASVRPGDGMETALILNKISNKKNILNERLEVCDAEGCDRP